MIDTSDYCTIDSLLKFMNIPDESKNNIAQLSAEEIRALLNKLHSYQMELLVQNEHLRHTQEELSHSRKHFELLYDEAPAGYLTLTYEGRIIEANKFCTELLGSTKQGLIGKKFALTIHPDDQAIFDAYFKRMIACSDKASCEVRVNKQDEHIITVALQGIPQTNGAGVIQIWMVLHDITARKEAEQIILDLNQELDNKIDAQNKLLSEVNEQLRQNLEDLKHKKMELSKSEATLKSIFNAAAEVIITTDHRGRIISANKAATTLFGYSEEELIGTDFNRLTRAPYDGDYNFSVIKKLYSNRSMTSKTREVSVYCKNGKILPADLSVSTFKIGTQRFFTGVLRDAREREQKREQEKQHVEELAYASRLGLMGEMAAGIAHEINQPLAAIAAYAQFLIRTVQYKACSDPEKIIETLEKIDAQALLAGQKIHRMRDFVTRNKLHNTNLNVNSIVEDAIELSAAELRKFNINYRCQLADELPQISVNRVQIEQVLLNLIKNSIEALQQKPSDYPKTLTIQTFCNNDCQIEIRVKDNGPGFDKQQKDKIFQPFYTTKASATGMGLAISRSIIENHKGILRCDSLQGRGSTFYVSLPAELNS